MTLRFEVLHTSWHADGAEFASGEQTVTDPSPQLVKLAGSAHAAGVIVVEEGLDDSHVEPQEVSEQKLVEAMGEWVEPVRNEDGTTTPGYWNGPWREGHEAQTVADEAAKASGAAEDVADIETVEPAATAVPAPESV